MPQDQALSFSASKASATVLVTSFSARCGSRSAMVKHPDRGVLAQHDLDGRAVLFDDHAVQGERPGQPLILCGYRRSNGSWLARYPPVPKWALFEVRRGASVWALMRRTPEASGFCSCALRRRPAPIGAEHEILWKSSENPVNLQCFNHGSTVSRSVFAWERKSM